MKMRLSHAAVVTQIREEQNMRWKVSGGFGTPSVIEATLWITFKIGSDEIEIPFNPDTQAPKVGERFSLVFDSETIDTKALP